MMKTTLLALAVATIIPLGFWIGGFGFAERGSDAAVAYILWLIAFAGAYVFFSID